jgi:DNA invertase Pin-like site-specific DNA recombinase
LSGFRGANTAQGNLGTFIRAVKEGKIERGICLCVEALDRITRQETTEAVHLFTELLLMGVQIGLVSDDKIITHDTIKSSPVELIVATTYLIRGHDESRMKSNRTGDAVQRMIENVKQGKPCNLGGYLPPWIKYDKERHTFIKDTDKALIVQRVFDEYLQGKGTTAIVKALVKGKVAKWNNTTNRQAPWRAGGIRSMLQNKQVIGTLKLGGMEFPKYLKPIISENDFNKVQLLLEKNTTRHGKHDGNANNLFNRHIFCAKCGSPLGVHKSSSKNYFYCLKARDYGCEDKLYVDTATIEQWVFVMLLKQAPSIMLADADTTTAKDIARLQTELALIKIKRGRTHALLQDDTTSTDDLKPILAQFKTREQQISKELLEASVKHNDARTAPKNFVSFIQLIGRDLKDQGIRHNIKALLPSVIRKVEVDLKEHHTRIELPSGQCLEKVFLTEAEAERL